MKTIKEQGALKLIYDGEYYFVAKMSKTGKWFQLGSNYFTLKPCENKYNKLLDK